MPCLVLLLVVAVAVLVLAPLRRTTIAA